MFLGLGFRFCGGRPRKRKKNVNEPASTPPLTTPPPPPPLCLGMFGVSVSVWVFRLVGLCVSLSPEDEGAVEGAGRDEGVVVGGITRPHTTGGLLGAYEYAALAQVPPHIYVCIYIYIYIYI